MRRSILKFCVAALNSALLPRESENPARIFTALVRFIG